MVRENSFKKAERLSLNKRIEILFSSGVSVTQHPVKILWFPFAEPLEYPAQVLFTVSSRRFKNAVDRNRIKRMLKEIYRVHKPLLYDELNRQDKRLLLGIIYVGNEKNPRFDILRTAFGKAIERLVYGFRSA